MNHHSFPPFGPNADNDADTQLPPQGALRATLGTVRSAITGLFVLAFIVFAAPVLIPLAALAAIASAPRRARFRRYRKAAGIRGFGSGFGPGRRS